MKKILSIILVMSMIFSLNVTFAFADDTQTTIKSFTLEEKFDNKDNLANYKTTFDGKNPLYIVDTDTMVAGFEYTSDGTLKITSNKAYKYFTNNNLYPAGKPKLVFSYDFKTNDLKNVFIGTRYNSGLPYGVETCWIKGGTVYDYDAAGKNLGSVTGNNEWHNVTVVYDNEYTTGISYNREIYIDGKLYGTVGSVAPAGGYNYVHGGRFWLALSVYAANSTAVVEIDNLELYSLPANFDFEIEKAKPNQIILNSDIFYGTPEGTIFSITDSEGNPVSTTVTSVTREDAGIDDLDVKFTLNLSEKLVPGNSYKLNITDLKLPLGATKSQTLEFQVLPERIQATEIATDITDLTDGTYSFQTDFYNETASDLNPVLAVAIYSATEKLENLQLVDLGTATKGVMTPLSNTFTIGTKPQGADYDHLKLFVLKSKSDFTPCSEPVIIGKTQTVYDFNPEASLYKDTFTVKNELDADNLIYSSYSDEITEEQKRYGVFVALKQGKTLPVTDVTDITALNIGELGTEKIPYKFGVADITTFDTCLYVQNTLNIKASGTVKAYPQSFIDSGLEIIKDITSTEVKDFVDTYKEVLAIDLTKYTGYQTEEFGKSVEALRNEKESKEFADFGEFFTAMDEAEKMYLIKTTSDVESEISTLDASVYTNLYNNTISDDAIASISNTLLTDKPSTLKEFLDDFNNLVILKGVQLADNYSQTQVIMSKLASETSYVVDLSIYNGLGADKKLVDSYVSGTLYGSIELLIDAYEEKASAVNASIIQNSTPVYSGGVGGGGGSTAIESPYQDPVTISPVTDNDASDKEEEVLENTTSFTDIDSVEWAKNAIINLANKNIINGKSAETFCPQDNVTRAEFVKIIVRAFGIDEVSGDINFNDVAKDDWYYSFVSAAFYNKLVSGMTDNEFMPNNNITREDAFVIIFRALSAKGKTFENTRDFIDGDLISSYAKEAIIKLGGSEFINGDANGQVNPKNNLTRAEAAVVVNNILAAQ